MTWRCFVYNRDWLCIVICIEYDVYYFYDPTCPKHDQTCPKHDQTSPKHDPTCPKHDQTSPKFDQTSPKRDQKSPKHDQTSPKDPREARSRAIAVLSAMVGSVAIARALEKSDPALSSEVLAAARAQLARLATQAGMPGPPAGDCCGADLDACEQPPLF